MSTPHPMWSALKRGMLLGALLGLNLAFLLTLSANGPIYFSQLSSYFVLGGGSGLFVGAVLGVIWRQLQRPVNRLEADLKAAGALRAKELINDADYQALKARILATYQPNAAGTQSIVSSAMWFAVIGITVAIGSMINDYQYAQGSRFITYMTLFVPVGTGIGTIAAAIIQSGLQSKGVTPDTSKPGMLGAGQFDPLDSIRTSEAQPANAANRR